MCRLGGVCSLTRDRILTCQQLALTLTVPQLLQLFLCGVLLQNAGLLWEPHLTCRVHRSQVQPCPLRKALLYEPNPCWVSGPRHACSCYWSSKSTASITELGKVEPWNLPL